MKNLLTSLITLLIFNNSFTQNSESELLKNYEFYVEKNIEIGNWSTKYGLKNGLVSLQENYWKNELKSRTKFEYDRFGNVEREIVTFRINDGHINDISNFKLEYKDSLLVRKKFDNGMTEKYSNFNKLGKPKLIERIEESDFKLWPFKEQLEYDNNGNIVKHIKFKYDYGDQNIITKATIHYKYNELNDVIEIHREFEPEREFPLLKNGPLKYEYEFFRYKYNKNGLWTKKFKTTNGKEILVAKRKYK